MRRRLCAGEGWEAPLLLLLLYGGGGGGVGGAVDGSIIRSIDRSADRCAWVGHGGVCRLLAYPWVLLLRRLSSLMLLLLLLLLLALARHEFAVRKHRGLGVSDRPVPVSCDLWLEQHQVSKYIYQGSS